jgi:hypothetical protein
VTDRLVEIEASLGSYAPDVVEFVRGVDSSAMRSRLEELSLGREVVEELLEHWDETRASPTWSSLLAALNSSVERDRGDIDAPIAIFEDLDDYGPSGRLICYYLFALQVDKMRDHHRRVGVPEDVSVATTGALARHGETHLLKHGTIGLDAGWWTIPILRGEILQVGSLKFHLVRLDVGTLAPRPWLAELAAARLGEGFRPGDLSLGVHIPARTDLSPSALDETFARARDVLSVVWPSSPRRLATCQSWMMDERLAAALGDASNVVRFQRRFTLIEPYEDDVDMVKNFVFGPLADGAELPASSSVQRAVRDVLMSGERWHNRTGWLLFD